MLSVDRVKSARELAWESALTSHMNAHYYRHKLHWWTRVDIGVRLVSAVAASATLVSFLRTKDVLGFDIAGWLGALAAVSGIVGTALKIPDKVRELGVLLSEYTRHATRFEKLFQADASDEEVNAALEEFYKTEEREAKDHPQPDVELLKRSQAQVLESIGAKPASA